MKDKPTNFNILTQFGNRGSCHQIISNLMVLYEQKKHPCLRYCSEVSVDWMDFGCRYQY